MPINFLKLVQRRKKMQQNTSEYEQIDKQIKDAEWLFMRTIFYFVEYCEANSYEWEYSLIMAEVISNFLSKLFLNPEPENFKKLNPVLNQKNIKDALNKIFQIVPEFYDEKIDKKKYFDYCNVMLKKNIFEIGNCFPQTTQGSYYLSNKGRSFFEICRNVEDENLKKYKEECSDEISVREGYEEFYIEHNIEQAFSIFEYCSSKLKNFDDIYYATNYLESRYIVCHFDVIYLKSNEQPDELTRNFFMKIWLENSIILQNLMRFYLNSKSLIHKNAKKKFRSDEFKHYALKNPEKIIYLIFAFIFMPNKFANCNDYEQLIFEVKNSKYYLAVMRIDKFMFKNYLDYKPYVYFENTNISSGKFYSLVKFFSKINPTKENKIDKLLLSNKLLIEIAINPDDNFKFDYIANLNSSNFNYHTENYSKQKIAKGICSLIITVSEYNFSQEQENFLKNYLDKIDLLRLNYITSVLQQYPEELDNIVDSISNDLINNQDSFDIYNLTKKFAEENKLTEKDNVTEKKTESESEIISEKENISEENKTIKEEDKITEKDNFKTKYNLPVACISFIIAVTSLAFLISLFFPPFVLLKLAILSCIGAGLILTTGISIAFGIYFLNKFLQSKKNLQDLSESKNLTEKNKLSKSNQTYEIYKGNGKPNQYKYSDRTDEYSDM